jgi:ribulose-phosphate 3-epimerase
MIEIIPAILPKSFADLEEHLARIHGITKAVQVDVVDGTFAHNKTWPYKDHASFEKIVSGDARLPLWNEVDFEFDLMIENPDAHVKQYVDAGASRIVLHARSSGVETALQHLVDMREETGAFVVSIGIAISAEAQPETLEPFEAQFDFVQVMGILHEGFQGEPFDHHAISLVERLRRRYPELPLQVDGAVSLENARKLVLAGANRLIVGSAIFNNKTVREAYNALYTEVNGSE